MKFNSNKNPARLKQLKYIIPFLMLCNLSYAQEVGILKYDGGGDWYANPTAIPNLIRFCNENIRTNIEEKPDNIEPQSKELFNYPIVFLTGHGNVYFSEDAIDNIRNYLISGGFLHISDNYGLDSYIRREMKKVFPEIEFVEIPFDHSIYHQSYDFEGLPKIHELLSSSVEVPCSRFSVERPRGHHCPRAIVSLRIS